MRIRCLQHTCGTINIIILPCGNIRACARRRQGQRRLERPYPSLPVDSRCRAAAPSRARHTNSLPGAVIRSHPRCTALPKVKVTAAQSGSYCCPKWKLLLPKVEVTAAQSGSYCCPKWKLLLPKVEVRCLSAARLESANLNTLPKWKGAIIKSICSQSLNCGAHQRAAHYHAPCTPPSPWRSASGLARPSAGRLVGASPRGTVRRSHLGAIRCNQWQSVAISGNQKEPFRSHQRQSEAISGNQWQSEGAI